MWTRMKSALEARLGRSVYRTGLRVMGRLGMLGQGAFGIIHPEKIGTLEKIADGVGMIHSFANVGLVYGRGGVLVVDASARLMSDQVVRVIRSLTSEPIQHIVYTHGHVDHTGGVQPLLDDVQSHGTPLPTNWAH